MGLVEKIKVLCKEKKISIAELERRVGISNGQIRKWEISTPGVDKLNMVADYFNVSIDYLLGRSLQAKIDSRLKEKGISYEELASKTDLNLNYLSSLERIDSPKREDFDAVKRIAEELDIESATLIKALHLQEPPVYEGSKILPQDDFSTIAAHHVGEDWTEEELQEIEQFKKYVRSKRGFDG